MSFDHIDSFVSACIGFVGLIFVGLQLRDSTRQRESESIVKLYDINRELLSLAFLHPSLFDVLEDKPIKDHLSEKRYLQLWLNQISLSHTFRRHAVVQPELQQEHTRTLTPTVNASPYCC